MREQLVHKDKEHALREAGAAAVNRAELDALTALQRAELEGLRAEYGAAEARLREEHRAACEAWEGKLEALRGEWEESTVGAVYPSRISVFTSVCVCN